VQRINIKKERIPNKLLIINKQERQSPKQMEIFRPVLLITGELHLVPDQENDDIW
jgi:predicted NAD-dependent protein-ADP-ribosyltransferase YbiA (DUF1768 family)